MATLLQLESESYWGREEVPPSLDRCFRAACRHFGTDPSGGGTRGNTVHLTGRHRSVEWVRNSAFCTDRSYGTRDGRDTSGNPRIIRAFDVPLPPPQMVAVSRRLDAAVRAGRAPKIAEWFGTFDNRAVTGWFEGHRSSADSSHLLHVHVGLWTRYADGDLSDVLAILTGDDMDLADHLLNDDKRTVNQCLGNTETRAAYLANVWAGQTTAALAAQAAKLDALTTVVGDLAAGTFDPAQLTQAVDDAVTAAIAPLHGENAALKAELDQLRAAAVAAAHAETVALGGS